MLIYSGSSIIYMSALNEIRKFFQGLQTLYQTYLPNVDHYTRDSKPIIHINCNTSEIGFSIVLSLKKRESMQTMSKMIYASKIA